ncbi:glycosyltransferase family 4 protein [Paenibacillus glufosinatiresistens]|uniref:glycosyltransferase family 4 protein n=1 Tax=Paenibacillus glufosinatiresistens TaxID=3070657 RepID=UPI00286DDEB3|nr:glycosyltransferase family 4 protein [Paenibacillus sp. YX.27]
MANKILLCATVDFHFSSFHLPVMEWFKQQNWEVHVAANGDMDLPFTDRKFNIPFERSPLGRGNLEAYRRLKELMDREQYQIIHAHTPMGGALARLAAAKSRKRGTKVLYTAHGFHFCQGAPLLNWMLYYPIEKMLAGRTDCLITINQEDYRLAEARFRPRRLEHVHGVGIDCTRFAPVDEETKRRLRRELPYPEDDLLIFYAAEFNRNKNQQLLIRALASVSGELPEARLLLAGRGGLLEECRTLADSLGVGDRVHFLGYRTDLDRLLPLCDLAVSGSLREGLPVNIMEAMACGLPIVATRNRGHLELVEDGVNGYLVPAEDPGPLAGRLLELGRSAERRREMGARSRAKVADFGLERVVTELSGIYKTYMTDTAEAESVRAAGESLSDY